jgi:mannose-1-phosphate guanylyltransferase/mannose-6-phosphate isomerase
MAKRKISPVIMCGGAGTRLWPISRQNMPKQFIPFFGKHSSFQETIRRVSDPALFGPVTVVTNDEFRFIVKDQLKSIEAEARIILEPIRRDSGPAIAVAAELAERTERDATVLALPADHLVPEPEAFRNACRAALHAAELGRIVAFGIRPTSPTTAYGYIGLGDIIDGTSAHEVRVFAEKPDQETAARYISEGYLWNSGNFLFRAGVMLKEIEQREPSMLAAARAALDNGREDLGCLRLDNAQFSHAPKKSIDYAVMEHTTRAAVLPACFGWSDIGSWNAVWELSEKDAAGNVYRGAAATLESRNVYVHSDDHILTTVVGLDNITVISTVDAVLVLAREKADQVKDLVDLLKNRNLAEASEHKRGYRPWGYYQCIDTGSRFQVKRILVNPGAQLSLQKHVHRAEHWVVVRGTAEVTVDDRVKMVQENEAIYVPLGAVHRLRNPGKIPLELIEVQVGSYLGEDDIVRLDDIYNRVPAR